VSIRPCDGRAASATRRYLPACGPIEVRSEPVELHPRSAPECGDGCLGAYKSMPTQRGKLADGDPVSGHDEGRALVELAHDLADVIAKLTLIDLPGPSSRVARVLRRCRTSPFTHTDWQSWPRSALRPVDIRVTENVTTLKFD